MSFRRSGRRVSVRTPASRRAIVLATVWCYHPVMSTRGCRDREIDAWRAFLKAYAVVLRALERELQERHGIPLTWYDVLVHLEAAPQGRLRMQALADSLVLSRSGVTRVVDRMVQAGLVERVSYREDRRGTWAVITPEGRRMLREAAPDHLQGVYRHFLRHLRPRDLAELHRMMERVIAGEEAAVPSQG